MSNISVQKPNSSSRVKDISSLYLKSDDNLDSAGVFNKNITNENLDAEKIPVCKIPSLPQISKTLDMDFELEQVPSNNYVLVDRTNSHILTKTETYEKDVNLLSFDAYKNNIPSSSSVTQLSFMNKNSDHFAQGKNVVDEVLFLKKAGLSNIAPKSAHSTVSGRLGSGFIKTNDQNKSRQKQFSGNMVFKGSGGHELVRVKSESLRPKSSISVNKSRQSLIKPYGSTGIESDFVNIVKLHQHSRDAKSNGMSSYLASSPPNSAAVHTPTDKFKSLLGMDYRSKQTDSAAVNLNKRLLSLNKSYNGLLGGVSTTKETIPLLLKSRNAATGKFEDFYKIIPKVNKVRKPRKSKNTNTKLTKGNKSKSATDKIVKTYLDNKTKKNMLIFHNYEGKTFKPPHIKIHKHKNLKNVFRDKNAVIYCDCYSEIVAFENETDISNSDKVKLQSMMHILFLEQQRRSYTTINVSDVYSIDMEKLQTNNKLYKSNGELISTPKRDMIISEDEDANASALKNVLFINQSHKRSSSASVEKDLYEKSLPNMSNKEFTMDIEPIENVSMKVKKSDTKPVTPVVEEEVVIIGHPTTVEVEVEVAPLKSKSLSPLQPLVPKKSSQKTRTKSGCWTCRLRKKKCTEEKDECLNCKRMRVPCDYSVKKPSYMDTPTSKKTKLIEIKQISIANKHNNPKKSFMPKI